MERNWERVEKMRTAVRHLMRTGHIAPHKRNGAQTRLAAHFGVTRQRIAQIVRQERQ